MGETVSFPSNGGTANGYLATPAGGSGPGVLVIQEWWGLVPHICDIAERLASAGFFALAPDLYHGEMATEPDGAGKLMMALNIQQAAKDLSGAVDFLNEKSTGSGIGVIGFCMGGGLALVLACQRPDAVKAVAPFYGVIPWSSARPDWSKLEGVLEGHYAEHDDFASPVVVRALEGELKDLGKEASFKVYPGTKHGFFNDTRADQFDEAAASSAWLKVIDLFRRELA
jgi:carboxymethylenebutenolidase